MNVYVFDACALIAFLGNEDGANIVREMLEKAGQGEDRIIIHSNNLCEVYYDHLRVFGDKKAETMIEEILELPLEIISEVSIPLLKLAGKFKVEKSISFADSFVLALAKTEKASIVTTDHHEFDRIEEEGNIPFIWIR
ncbi:MAG: type II toxin-antitoxin system VapC family toxin [bacterium]